MFRINMATDSGNNFYLVPDGTLGSFMGLFFYRHHIPLGLQDNQTPLGIGSIGDRKLNGWFIDRGLFRPVGTRCL
jgi:hypothetical protein